MFDVPSMYRSQSIEHNIFFIIYLLRIEHNTKHKVYGHIIIMSNLVHHAIKYRILVVVVVVIKKKAHTYNI